jgi:hypothetical protein
LYDYYLFVIFIWLLFNCLILWHDIWYMKILNLYLEPSPPENLSRSFELNAIIQEEAEVEKTTDLQRCRHARDPTTDTYIDGQQGYTTMLSSLLVERNTMRSYYCRCRRRRRSGSSTYWCSVSVIVFFFG